jgi:CDP-6-deoxy-D-xylo-4-hexulose-3-dehydrase
MRSPAELKAEILRLTREYSDQMHRANRPAEFQNIPFVPGKTVIPYAGRVFTADEVEAAVSSTLDFWLTLGPEGEAFERELAELLGVRHSLLVNSGSSANLVAVSALTTHKLPAHKRLQHGDEVITVAAGFPTTVTPILQCGAVPIFVDNDPITGNIRPEQLELAYQPGKTKAVMIAHALGNPFDLGSVLEFCRRHDLWLVEDNCDALGCTYAMPIDRAKALGITENSPGIPADGTHITRYTGTWGDLSTQSFYPPHHLTMGEGGAVNIISRASLKAYAESFRDWGRDCWCASGKDDTCGKRFGWQLGELPKGYDHKYIYSHLGYNLKPLDPQAAIGRQQIKKLPAFIDARKRNWEVLRAGLDDLRDVLDFTLPTHAVRWIPPAERRGSGSQRFEDCFEWDASGCRVDASWFGFMVRVKPTAPFTRPDLAKALDAAKIGNRMLFGGNLIRQPAFVQLRKDRPEALRIVGDLKGADHIMNESLFVGTYPGLTKGMLDYVVEVIHTISSERRR